MFVLRLGRDISSRTLNIIKQVLRQGELDYGRIFIIPRTLRGDKQHNFFICVKQGGRKTWVDYFIPKS